MEGQVIRVLSFVGCLIEITPSVCPSVCQHFLWHVKFPWIFTNFIYTILGIGRERLVFIFRFIIVVVTELWNLEFYNY